MTIREFFFVDPKDVWNWVLGIVAIALLWWGISTIIKSLSMP